jgi:hypothetical protein
MDDKGAFSIDLTAGYILLIIMLVTGFISGINLLSTSLSGAYSIETIPVAASACDVLVTGTGDPADWHRDPRAAHNASCIGLSAGRPNILSRDKIEALCFLNASELAAIIGIVSDDNPVGFRIEALPHDGSPATLVGYPVPASARDVSKATRLAAIENDDGTYTWITINVYAWRERTGSAA